MSLLSIFGALALVLAAIGTYAVMSQTVAQRTGEIGVRMAFGAEPRDVLGLVSRDGMLRTGIGLVAGLVISLGMTRLLSTELFAVSALDATTYIATTFVLAGVAFAACYIPARRAAKVDPMIVLRYE
jgi:putative ABC transport system permease protein